MGAETPGPPVDFELRREFGNAEANLRFLDQALLASPDTRILEVGTGRGTLLNHLVQQGLSARGVEIGPDRIAESRALYGELPVDRISDTRLPFPDASFDVVMSFDVFEHIRESDAHLHEVHRVLVPGGRYLFQTPNKWTNSVFETVRWRSLTAWRTEHCALHTYGQLRRRLERHGFEVRFRDIPVVTDFFRHKLRHYLGPLGSVMLTLISPDRLPLRFRTNFYAEARKSH